MEEMPRKGARWMEFGIASHSLASRYASDLSAVSAAG